MNEELKIKAKWPIWRKLLVGFLALTAIMMAVSFPAIFWQLHEADKSFHAFGDALIARDYTRAYDYTSPELRAATDYAAFLKVHEGLTGRMGELKGVEVSQSETKELSDGWYANFDTRLSFARGSLFFTFVLKKENGTWKIYSYHEQ